MLVRPTVTATSRRCAATRLVLFRVRADNLGATDLVSGGQRQSRREVLGRPPSAQVGIRSPITRSAKYGRREFASFGQTDTMPRPRHGSARTCLVRGDHNEHRLGTHRIRGHGPDRSRIAPVFDRKDVLRLVFSQ